MTAAIFALIGTFLGISGTLLVEIRRERIQDSRSRREALRITCAEFTDSIIRLRELTLKMEKFPSDSVLRETVYATHSESWAHYERLRLISTSQDLQEAGRKIIRYSWGLIKQVEGNPPRDDEKPDGPFALLLEWLQKFYVAARRELGVPKPENVYPEPPGWRKPHAPIK